MKSKLLKVKICGIKFDVQKISDLLPNFIGFIFYPNSPRFVGFDFVIPKIRKKILKVGVFVNESEENILKIKEKNKLDFIQLHGTENPFYCEKLSKKGLKLIKSFRINNFFSFKKIVDYIPFCTYFLFDNNTIHYGGSGQKFCWNKLYEYTFQVPFFLSGGIGTQDFDKIINFSHSKIFGVDVNSKFEIFPGKKDDIKLNAFMKKIRKL
ncbi:phosphoribosylanthranilate isomerase [Blattabacterium sp. (Blaberus giganteus)]|uniref:phosphoribosylanthranilate isomerase n=1 Tax=Blattabacterium sp. (Blaberus giganteus) TaxID=1186051 RepID=UPI00025F6ED5|nr:phosphoribosylanthranilate isomerase [Blattabacterium sp. (Blaberus giganteus)]AFJ90662.1 bifunctional phosphoribosylanthranilate isomerase/tryptophan synthase subunit beta [Blattabacterium sp. (Blaberus giganteus)]